MSNPDDYTVGWICAISTEYVAAQAFLDEKHEGPEYVSPNDNNDYTLGKVGKHSVVIAVLPDGEYGTASAAMVARDMLHSFRNIRLGLMVGIGGGAPSRQHDIRLGDIVVSAPHDGNSGVFQYDFGKTVQGQSFRTTGFLNQPPTILRTAVSGLKSKYEVDGHQFEATIDNILEKKVRLRKKYKRPDLSNDRLYQSTVIHPAANEASCVAVCGDNLISRSERTEEEDNPTIHYGLIASANQLMKDATIRDKLAAEKNVLCFEMEAAGLMNHFPCLVIRGICDYSDSHKNKEWQGYAAMAAAAYAKDVLIRIPPNKAEAEKRIIDILSDVQEGVGKLLQVHYNQAHEAILNWLTRIDYVPQQIDYLNRRQLGTGQWLLDSVDYQAWLKSNKQTLFCPGIPGAGKTILTSIVVDDLSRRFSGDSSTGIGYIYCNFRRKDEQKIDDLLASLLKQLSKGQSSLPGSVQNLYDKYKHQQKRPSLDGIESTLQSVAKLYSRVFVIIDALDECQSSNHYRQRFLSKLFNLQTTCGANIFATSRFIDEITSTFDGSMTLEIRASKNDVKSYMEDHMEELPSVVQGSRELQEEIKTGISEAVDGMFLLAQIYLRSLEDKLTMNAIRSALEGFRKQGQGLGGEKVKLLADAYNQAMVRIEEQRTGFRELATMVLSWITSAKRPLTTLELRYALAVKAGKSEIDQGDLLPLRDIVSACVGLVTIDNESNIIRLVHYTTQEYFERTQEQWFPNTQSNITISCITCLSFDVFKHGFGQTDHEFEERLHLNPFYKYAAQNWGHHALGHVEVALQQPILSFLENDYISCASKVMFTPNNHGSGHSVRLPKNVTGMHLAAFFGLNHSIQCLIQRGAEPDPIDDENRTPLSLAAEHGHEKVVKLLLQTRRVDINSYDSKHGYSTLSWAVVNGHAQVVRLLLLDERTDVNTRDKRGRTPLSLSAGNGHLIVTDLLLQAETIDTEMDDGSHQTPLSWAAGNGHKEIVELLIKSVKEVDSRSFYRRTPLSWAAENGHQEVVELLLKTKRVDPDIRDTLRRRSPLSFAAEHGHQRIVEMLLATENVEVSSRDDQGRTPLRLAKENNHEAIFKLLLESGKLDEDLSAPAPPKYVPKKLYIFKVTDDSTREQGFDSIERKTLRPEDFWEVVDGKFQLTVSRTGWAGAMMYAHASSEKFAIVMGVTNGHPWSAIVTEVGDELLKGDETMEDIMRSFYPSKRPPSLRIIWDWVENLATKPLSGGRIAKLEIISEESELARNHSVTISIE